MHSCPLFLLFPSLFRFCPQLFLLPILCAPPEFLLQYLYIIFYIYGNNRSSSLEKECFVMEKMMMAMKDGWLGKISRNMYAVLCLGIVLFAVAYVYYAFPEEEPINGDTKERSKRRLTALQSSPLR
ncbi:hypothetical protein DsansV1_C23g0179961 [Dioscorea sansibarensis]